jgi:hypothetical protein
MLDLRDTAPDLDPTKTQNQDADSLLIGGRQHGCYAIIASEQSVLRSLRTCAR